MFAKLRKFLAYMLGGLFYWIGWGLAVIVLVQAIILSLASGSPAVPVLLGVAGVILYFMGIGIKTFLTSGPSIRH
ncbi:MAG TPA: hypothetical protein VGF53_14845 [Pseudolabrys sp.]|jgi:hypothetical protein